MFSEKKMSPSDCASDGADTFDMFLSNAVSNLFCSAKNLWKGPPNDVRCPWMIIISDDVPVDVDVSASGVYRTVQAAATRNIGGGQYPRRMARNRTRIRCTHVAAAHRG